MPLPNGVDPWGRFALTCPDAALMGNRGILHGDGSVIEPQFKHKNWVACEMAFRGRSRKPLMQPNRYTELFFLDEATALAAGHRSCGECRRKDHANFKQAWLAAFPETLPAQAVKEMDRALHAARVGPGGAKKTCRARLSRLPPGVMVEVDGKAHLSWNQLLYQWSASGYVRRPAGKHDADADVVVLTPEPVVAVLLAGYVPRVHPCAT